MNSNYRTSSRWQRFLAALAAGILTGTLFTAVAVGLTGNDGFSLFTHYDHEAAHAVVQPA